MKSAFSPFVAVLVMIADPAVDRSAMEASIVCADGQKRSLFEAYLLTYDERFLRLKDGSQPRRFTLSPLRQRVVNRLVDDPDNPTGDELWELAQACITNVEDPSGKFEIGEDDRQRPDGDGVRSLRAEAMERLAGVIGTKAVRELGHALLRKAMLPEWAVAPFVSAGGTDPISSTTV